MSSTSTPHNDTTNAYFRTQVLTAPPERLRLMLLEGAVKFARQGREAIAAKNYEAIYTGFSKARDIVVELMTSISPDTDPDLRSKVQALYAFIFKLLMECSFERDAAKADKAIELLEYEVETWRLAMARLAEERGEAAPAVVATDSASESRPALSVHA